jgi:ERCC4-type nuclease
MISGDTMTDKKLQTLLSNIEIIIDTRENNTKHLTDYWDKQNIQYKFEKLDQGDYSFRILPCSDIGFNGMSYADIIAIERKADLTEISGNVSQQRDRFERELLRAKENNMSFTLLIEDGSFEDIIRHRYSTNLSEKSFIASLLTFRYRYNIAIEFIPKQYAGAWIYRHFYYYAREIFKN